MNGNETGAAAIGNAASLAHEVNLVSIGNAKPSRVRINYTYSDTAAKGPAPDFSHMRDNCTCGHHLCRNFVQEMCRPVTKTKTTKLKFEINLMAAEVSEATIGRIRY